MGSWNGTCGISQLPITYGDDVAIFFMKENEFNEVDYNGCVHSDTFYVPVSPAIIGKYDDYGKVRNVQADSRIINVLYGKQENYNDIDEIIDKQSKENKLFIMLVHLDIYEKIISEFGGEKEFFTAGLPLEEHFKEKLVSHIKKRRKHRIDSRNNSKHLPFNPELEFAYRFLGNSLEFYQNFYDNDEIYDNVEEDSLVHSVTDLLIFRHAMQVSRKLWIPQAGQGSQDREMNLAKFIGEFAIEKEIKDEYV